jgi:hypothetical protein
MFVEQMDTGIRYGGYPIYPAPELNSEKNAKKRCVRITNTITTHDR